MEKKSTEFIILFIFHEGLKRGLSGIMIMVADKMLKIALNVASNLPTNLGNR